MGRVFHQITFMIKWNPSVNNQSRAVWPLTEIVDFDVLEIISREIPWHISLLLDHNSDPDSLTACNLESGEVGTPSGLTGHTGLSRHHLTSQISHHLHHQTPPHTQLQTCRARLSIQTQSQHGASLSHDRSEEKHQLAWEIRKRKWVSTLMIRMKDRNQVFRPSIKIFLSTHHSEEVLEPSDWNVNNSKTKFLKWGPSPAMMIAAHSLRLSASKSYKPDCCQHGMSDLISDRDLGEENRHFVGHLNSNILPLVYCHRSSWPVLPHRKF